MADVIAPPYTITKTDKRGLVVVITATSLSFIWTCFLIRIWLRSQTREWKSDDYFLAAASVLDTVQSALVFRTVGEGLGRTQGTLSDSDLKRIGKDDFASQILYILTLLLSKCAVLFLYLRLSPGKNHAIASWGTVALSSLWALVSIILIAVPCNPSHFWSHGTDRCSNIYTKWQFIGALDIITEVFVFLISIYLVARLNMKFKPKAMVVAAFSARLPVIIAAAFRLYYLKTMLSSPDRPLEASYYAVCTQWQMGYAIMSSTITGLGPFLRPFSKSFTASYHHSSSARNPSNHVSSMHSSGTGLHTGGQSKQATSYQLSPLQARTVSVITSGHDAPTGRSSRPSNLVLRPDEIGVRRDTNVSGGGELDEEDEVSRTSNESRRMIITKKTELKVSMDRASSINRREWRDRDVV